MSEILVVYRTKNFDAYNEKVLAIFMLITYTARSIRIIFITHTGSIRMNMIVRSTAQIRAGVLHEGVMTLYTEINVLINFNKIILMDIRLLFYILAFNNNNYL